MIINIIILFLYFLFIFNIFIFYFYSLLSGAHVFIYYYFFNFQFLFNFIYLLSLYIYIYIFFSFSLQIPNSFICLNSFSLLAHLVFYITFVSNFQLLLVVCNIWIVPTFRFFIKSPEEGRLVRPKYWETSSRFSLCCFVIYVTYILLSYRHHIGKREDPGDEVGEWVGQGFF